MQIFRSLAEIPPAYGPTVVSIGNFDGVHRGHRFLIEQAIRGARGLSAHSLVVTFDPHPARVLRPEGAPLLITPMPQRLELLAATGIEAVLVLPFTPELAQMSGREFVKAILADSLRAAEVHEGDNFRFGHRAQSGARELIEVGHELGFRVTIYPPLTIRGMTVSSSKVRECIQAGDMTAARALLGRPFAIRSTPAPGRGIGSRLTVPTINLSRYDELLPVDGVYISKLEIGGRVFEAVTNAGNRPTFGENSFAVESYLLNYDPARDPLDLTPETPLELTFLQRLRDERKYPSPEALKAQISEDVSHAREYFRLLHSVAGDGLSPSGAYTLERS